MCQPLTQKNMSTVNMLRKNKNIQIVHKKNVAKFIKIIKYDNIC